MKYSKDLKKYEELITGESDEEYLMGLNEVERELIFNMRYEKLQAHEHEKSLKKLFEEKTQLPKSEIAKHSSVPRYPECDFLFPRDFIQKNVWKPFFNKFRGCFVRAAINDKHLICKIVGIEKINRYTLMGKTKMNCTVGLNLDTGVKVVKSLQINSISSSNATEEEFDVFIKAFSISSVENLKSNYRSVKEIFEKSMTDVELTQFLKNRTDDNPVKKTNTQRKIEIISKRDEAIQSKNKDRALYFQNQLELIEDEERLERQRKMIGGTNIHRDK